MTTRCEHLRETLSAYIDGEESSREASIARAHLESCGICRQMTEEWQAIEAAIPIEEDAPFVDERTARRLAAPVVPRGRRLTPLLAAAILGAMVAGGSMLAASVGTPAPERPRAGVAAPPTIGRPGTGLPAPMDAEESAEEEEESSGPRPSSKPSDRPTIQPSERPTSFEPRASRGTNGELLLVLTMERSDAAPGELVRAGVVLRNVTDHDVTFTSPARSPVDLILRDRAGEEAYRRSVAERWEKDMTTRTLRPGETIAEEIVFEAPAPGGYLVVAQCVCFPPDLHDRDPAIADRTTARKAGPFETQPLKFVVAKPQE